MAEQHRVYEQSASIPLGHVERCLFNGSARLHDTDGGGNTEVSITRPIPSTFCILPSTVVANSIKQAMSRYNCLNQLEFHLHSGYLNCMKIMCTQADMNLSS